jgi:hypothetical protein
MEPIQKNFIIFGAAHNLLHNIKHKSKTAEKEKEKNKTMPRAAQESGL